MPAAEEEGGLRRGRRWKWRILGVGGGGGWWCHLGLLVDILSCSEKERRRRGVEIRRVGGVVIVTVSK